MATEPTNKFYTPAQTASVLVNMIAEGSFLSALVSRNFENDLLGGGGKGRVVNLKLPNGLVAHSRDVDDVTNKIILDRLEEKTIPLTLGKHVYNAVGLSEGELNLDLSNFSEQVLSKQAEAVVADLEHEVRKAFMAEAYDTAVAWNPDAPEKSFTRIRKALRDRGLAQAGLVTIVGSEVYAQLLDAKAIVDVSQSGSTEALKEGNVGKLRGFTIAEDAELPEGDIVAFHRDAVTLATRAPAVPRGAANGAMITERGFQLRHIMDYDTDVTQDRSLVSTFAGVAKLPVYKTSRIHDTGMQGDADFTVGEFVVQEQAGGGIFRMSITDAEPAGA